MTSVGTERDVTVTSSASPSLIFAIAIEIVIGGCGVGERGGEIATLPRPALQPGTTGTASESKKHSMGSTAQTLAERLGVVPGCGSFDWDAKEILDDAAVSRAGTTL